ncbi:MAG: hypothetical protein NZ583_07150 [Desulfobacterota bacterium]|nr:hypothetical protein [Thermodesulfobacteriota bacterium]MDW8002145.1 hypothetical protein [Deltaproteobacteria bacterium]
MKKMRVHVIALAIILASFFTPTEEAHFVWERLPIFSCAFGFFGTLALIVLAKLLGKRFLERDINYYD